MIDSQSKIFYYALFVVFLLIAWLIVGNLEDVDIAEESQKLKESASKSIKEGTQKFKERYIENDENTSAKLKEDIQEIGDKFEESVEKTADMAVEKSKEAGQKLLNEGKNIVKKVSDYVVPEEIVNVGFSKAVNQETTAASHKINYFSVKSAVQHGQKISKMGIELSCDLSTLPPKNVDANYLSSCKYALRRFSNSQRSCIASTNNSLLLKSTELISETIQSICENACEQKKHLIAALKSIIKSQTLPSDNQRN